MSEIKELILGAGSCKEKKLYEPAKGAKYSNPVTIDIDPRSSPDIVWDLNKHPIPVEDGSFDEIHAYEVLEHLGRQGDWMAFFDEWNDYYRILKPKGRLYASCPSLQSRWLWGDPGHTRVISVETLTFLSQEQYEKQVETCAMTDYRHWYSGDFKLLYERDDGDNFWFILEKIGGI